MNQAVDQVKHPEGNQVKSINQLLETRCQFIPPKQKPMIIPLVEAYASQLDWQADIRYKALEREFVFKNYQQVMSFLNAISWIFQKEDHYPSIQLSYNQCVITLKTTAIDGLSLNDMIIAAKINQLYALQEA